MSLSDDILAARCGAASRRTPAQKRAYVIADNKLAFNAEWDEELLTIEFAYDISTG